MRLLYTLKFLRLSAVCVISLLLANISYASSATLQIFPLNNYQQNIDHWIKPSDPSYTKPLVNLDYQKERVKEFYNHYFETAENGLSPWSKEYVNTLLKDSSKIKNLQQELLKEFSNEGLESKKIGYGENFRPHPKSWIDKISSNMNLEQFSTLSYSDENRGILVQNTYARALPTLDPHFYHHELPGQGYPFDNLQMSSLWTGTPVYIIGQSFDKHWLFVATPDVNAWVQAEAIAKTNSNFIQQWQKHAKNKMAAITKTETTITDSRNKDYHFKSYVGSVFPMLTEQDARIMILFPAKDIDGNATIKRALVDKECASKMPLVASPENFTKIIKTLQNRPYGWGGLYFYNDCSAELKSLYTPFGIWLARHSSEQTKAGKNVDQKALSPSQRIAYLMEHGKPFLTFVYNTNHVFMYLGKYPTQDLAQQSEKNTRLASAKNTKQKASDNLKMNNAMFPLTYQNVWGLKPIDASRRAVIGQSVIFPVLQKYPEDSSLNSMANHKDFQVIFLDEWP